MPEAGPFGAGASWERRWVEAKMEWDPLCCGVLGDAKELKLCCPKSDAAALGATCMCDCTTQTSLQAVKPRAHVSTLIDMPVTQQ